MTCMKQEFCIHEKYCQRHIGQNFDSCILFSRNSNPQTNEEWRKTCSAEEFAEWITDKINAKIRMALHDAELYPDDINENDYMENEDEWVEWLKQPHKEE